MIVSVEADAPDMLRRLLRAGMSVVRINFSHGDFAAHAETIARVRAAAREEGLPVAVIADLPGPKIRIGVFEREPVELRRGARFTLTAADTPGTEEHVSTTLPELPKAVGPGSRIFLNDGTIVRDGPLDERYVNLPPECIGAVVVMRAGEYDGTCWPYTKFSAALLASWMV